MSLIVFAHGAGAGPESDFMQAIRSKLEEKGHKVHTFAFPYWQKVLESGKKRPPDRAAALDAHFIAEVRKAQMRFPGDPLVLLGKSMGSRSAFRIADAVQAQAVIALGFPFHPPGKPENDRTAELFNSRQASLVIQGSSDPFGKPNVVNAKALPTQLQIRWLERGNHDLVAAKATGLTQDQCWQQVSNWIDEFIQQRQAL